MLVNKNYFKYARFAVFGLNKEQVLFKLKDKVCFFNIEKSESKLEFSTSKKDYKTVLLFLKRQRANFKVLRQLNFLYFLRFGFKNAGIFLGIFFWVLFYLFFSQNNYGIKVVSSELTTDQTMQAVLLLKDSISQNKNLTNRELERAVLTKLDFLSGITIKKDGFCYSVSLYKRHEKKPQTEIIAPYNLKIKEAVAVSGECLVSPGDVVLKGTVLAKSKTENSVEDPPKILLKADAYVIGTSFFNKNAPVLARTGNSYTESIISVFGINLIKPKAAQYKYYDVCKSTICVSFNTFLPIDKTTFVYFEKDFINLENSQPDMQNLKQQAKQDALATLIDYYGEYTETYTVLEDNGNVVVKCYLKFDYQI